MTQMIDVASMYYTSPKLEVINCPEKGGYAIRAKAHIPPQELLLVWAGQMVHASELEKLPQHIATHGIQIEDEWYQVPVAGQLQPGDYVNHSCAPNAGLSGPVSLVAMRAIHPGEEICFDYATCDSSPYDEFDCACGTSTCRGRITGNDWKRMDLQIRYAGYFSPYLQRKIKALANKLKSKTAVVENAQLH